METPNKVLSDYTSYMRALRLLMCHTQACCQHMQPACGTPKNAACSPDSSEVTVQSHQMPSSTAASIVHLWLALPQTFIHLCWACLANQVLQLDIITIHQSSSSRTVAFHATSWPTNQPRVRTSIVDAAGLANLPESGALRKQKPVVSECKSDPGYFGPLTSSYSQKKSFGQCDRFKGGLNPVW
jgi:hypothetical protein